MGPSRANRHSQVLRRDELRLSDAPFGPLGYRVRLECKSGAGPVLRTKLHRRIANIRQDAIHKTSATISQNRAVVALEDLRIVNMTRSAAGTVAVPGRNVAQKRGLNRRVLQ